MVKFFIVILAWMYAGNQHALTIELKSEQPLKGTAFIAIYNSESSFLTVKDAVITKTFSANDRKITVVLPAGTYAVTTYIDENNNQKLDKNWVGYPTEPFGFSRDAPIVFGPPSFSDAKFTLTTDLKQVITLR